MLLSLHCHLHMNHTSSVEHIAFLLEQPKNGRTKSVKRATVESLIVDPPNKGHNRNNLSIKDAS